MNNIFVHLGHNKKIQSTVQLFKIQWHKQGIFTESHNCICL